jgi:hypothetical protein
MVGLARFEERLIDSSVDILNTERVLRRVSSAADIVTS